MTRIADGKIDQALDQADAERAYAAAAQAAPASPAVTAPAADIAQPASAKPARAKVVAPRTARKSAPKKKAAPKPAAPKPTTTSQIKDTIMTKTTATDFTAKIAEVASEAQDRAKAAFEKGSALFADASEFSKGNVEAIVEAGKILGAGLQELGQTYASEGKSAFETLTADVKELTAVKSPADFFKLQGEIMRRSFDAAVATGSKRSEAFLKLANDSFAPIGTRVSVAIDKVKQAA